MRKAFRRSIIRMTNYVTSPTGPVDDSFANTTCVNYMMTFFLRLIFIAHLFSVKLSQRPPIPHVKMQLRREPMTSKFELSLCVPWPQDNQHDDSLQKKLQLLALPGRRILSFLPISSLLALRLVSKTTKSWVHSVFRSTLDLPFPFKSKEYETNIGLPSPQASSMCAKLIVNVAGSKIPLTTLFNIFRGAKTLPKYAFLKHLHVNAPTSDSFWPLLEFRMFIQRAHHPQLRRFSINGLSVEGLKALRWGPLTSYLDTDFTSAMWQQLTNLDISLTPEMGVVDLTSEEGMEALEILHDWIGSFHENEFEKVRFEWMGDQNGPNPFLLDQLKEMRGSNEKPKMQQLSWRNCKEIWLGGVRLDRKSSRKMMDRVNGLKRVMIWTSLLGRETKAGERTVSSRGREWVVIKLNSKKRNQTHLTEAIVREYYEEPEPQASHGQTLEDWSVEDMSEGIGKKSRGDSDDALSDASREVPFVLKCV